MTDIADGNTPMLVCRRVSELPSPRRTAEIRQCAVCDQSVWVAEPNLSLPVAPVCYACACDLIKGHPTSSIVKIRKSSLN